MIEWDCDERCEAMPECAVCGRRKKPRGRDSMDNGLCDRDCAGYDEVPTSGHLWPGELKRARDNDCDEERIPTE